MTAAEKRKYRNTKKWKDTRRTLLDATGYQCLMCGIEKRGKKSKGLHVHHVNEESYGNETFADLAVLCADCHKMLEKFLRRKTFSVQYFCASLEYYYNKSGGK